MDDPSKGPIPPALSPEEWASRSKSVLVEARPQTVPVVHYVEHDRDTRYTSQPRLCVSAHFSNATPVRDLNHAIGALALYGQPFGFTEDDVVLLHALGSGKPLQTTPMELTAMVNSLAARIEALLPPSDPQPWDYTPGAEKYEVSSNEGTPPRIEPDGTVCGICKRTAETRELHFQGREHVSRMFVCLTCWVNDFAPMIWRESRLLPPPGGLPPSDEKPKP